VFDAVSPTYIVRVIILIYT